MRASTWTIGAVSAIGLTLAAASPAAAQKETETVQRTIALPERGVLKLRNFSGDVRITAGSGRDVVIKAVRRAERERLDHIKLEIETAGSTVSIEANRRDSTWRDRDNNIVETEFDIQVPASAVLDVYGFSSDVTITGVTAAQKVETFSGRIVVNGAREALDVKTFSGAVDLDATGAGQSPSIQAETFSGSIRARLAENARGDVNFDSFSGSFDSQLPLMMRSARRNRVSGSLGSEAGGSTLRFKTFSGSVTVAK